MLAIVLAFVFGYSFTIAPVLRAGLGLGAALGVALAADTLSITVMEIVDNAVLLVIPGAMDAGLSSPLFWGSLAGGAGRRVRGDGAGEPGADRPRQGPRRGAPLPPLTWRPAQRGRAQPGQGGAQGLVGGQLGPDRG